MPADPFDVLNPTERTILFLPGGGAAAAVRAARTVYAVRHRLPRLLRAVSGWLPELGARPARPPAFLAIRWFGARSPGVAGGLPSASLHPLPSVPRPIILLWAHHNVHFARVAGGAHDDVLPWCAQVAVLHIVMVPWPPESRAAVSIWTAINYPRIPHQSGRSGPYASAR